MPSPHAATLRELWVPPDRPFGARVDVCVPVFEVGPADGRAEWADRLAGARGVPAVALAAAGTVGDRAGAVVAFRQEYYGLAGHVREARETSLAPLVTSGLIDVGAMAWGARPARFAKRSWARPEVDVEAVRAGSARVSGWLDRVLHPKVVVASQTRVIEAAADHGGRWVPSTPAIGIVPHDPDDVAHLASALCAPPVSAWAVRRAAGTALSPDAIRVSGALLLEVPLPVDVGAWAEATALAGGRRPRRVRAGGVAHVRALRRRCRGGLPLVDGSAPGVTRFGLPPTGGSSVGSRRHQEWPG